MKRTGLVTAATALVLVLVLVGCGSDESSALTRDELVEQGNKICKNATDEVTSSIDEAKPGATADEIAQRLDKIATIGEKLNEDLRGLEAPDDMADDLDAAITAQEDQVRELRDAQKVAEDGDLEGAQANAEQFDRETEAVTKKFDDLGMAECGSAAGS